MKKPTLSLIIPAYQEAARIESSLDELASFIERHHYSDTEVLVIVADSADGTAELAAKKAKLFKSFRIIKTGPVKGKGHQVRIGMIEAKGEYKLFMDADLATPLHHITEARSLMKQNADIIIAVRNLNVSHTGLRKVVSSLGNWLVQMMLLPGVKDTQCGFKAFRADVAEELFRRQTILGWGFDMELLAIARMRKYKVHQISAPDWSDKPNGTFEGAVTTAALKTLGELSVIVWRRWTGRYRHKSFSYQPNE